MFESQREEYRKHSKLKKKEGRIMAYVGAVAIEATTCGLCQKVSIPSSKPTELTYKGYYNLPIEPTVGIMKINVAINYQILLDLSQIFLVKCTLFLIFHCIIIL